MKPKPYHNFTDKYGNEYRFSDYMSFSAWWFNLSYKTRLSFPNHKALQNAAANSKEARTPHTPTNK